jgi:hypothetical protein
MVFITMEFWKFNQNNDDQNRNNGVLEILMALLCFYNKIQRELTHFETEHDLSHTEFNNYVN